LLAEVGGSGAIRLVNAEEIEKSGIELLVGFKGSEPVPLDSLTQSGGERSVALMAFLLALQQHLASPLRAIDEFDVHLDPVNRESIFNLIISSARMLGDKQFVAITPGSVTVPEDMNVNVIVVQNVGGESVLTTHTTPVEGGSNG
jgi:chromosome segregation protein